MGTIMGPPPRLPRAPGLRHAAPAVPMCWVVAPTVGKRTDRDPVARDLETTDVAAAARTVQARSREIRDTSRSTIESSADEAGFTTVTGGGRGGARRKNRKPAAQPLPTAQAPTEGAKSGGRVPPFLSSSTLRTGVSARGATAGNSGSGTRMTTFEEVAA